MEDVYKWIVFIAIIVVPWIVMGIMEWRRYEAKKVEIKTRYAVILEALNTEEIVTVVLLKNKETLKRKELKKGVK